MRLRLCMWVVKLEDSVLILLFTPYALNMIECYSKWCMHHEKTEPLCLNNKCRASEEDITRFEDLRKVELAKWAKEATK